MNCKVSVVWVTAYGLCHTPIAEQTEQCCVFQGSAYGGRFTLSASSCGSIKALAEWICGHLLWTKIQRAELYSANICNVCLDLTLHALHANNKYSTAQVCAWTGIENLGAPVLLYSTQFFDCIWSWELFLFNSQASPFSQNRHYRHPEVRCKQVASMIKASLSCIRCGFAQIWCDADFSVSYTIIIIITIPGLDSANVYGCNWLCALSVIDDVITHSVVECIIFPLNLHAMCLSPHWCIIWHLHCEVKTQQIKQYDKNIIHIKLKVREMKIQPLITICVTHFYIPIFSDSIMN